MITDDELIVKSKTILKELGIEINILEKKNKQNKLLYDK